MLTHGGGVGQYTGDSDGTIISELQIAQVEVQPGGAKVVEDSANRFVSCLGMIRLFQDLFGLLRRQATLF